MQLIVPWKGLKSVYCELTSVESSHCSVHMEHMVFFKLQ